MAVPAGLKFIGFEIVKVLFDRSDKIIKEGEFEVNIKHRTQTKKDNHNLFRVVFVINIDSKNNAFSLQVEAMGNFKIVGNPSLSTRNNYINLSSPSIIYPYLRAFISTITLHSGMHPITIPPLNFAAVGQKKKAVKLKK